MKVLFINNTIIIFEHSVLFFFCLFSLFSAYLCLGYSSVYLSYSEVNDYMVEEGYCDLNI